MIVLDASVLVEVLLHTDLGSEVRNRWGLGGTGHAPHLVAVEVTSAVRTMTLAGTITAEQGQGAIETLPLTPFRRHEHDRLLARVWQLRGNLTAYDATYVALAEALDAPLLTCDAKLAAAPGNRATIDLVAI